jgi:hypothetical protein
VVLPFVGFTSAAPESGPLAKVSAASFANPVRMVLTMAEAWEEWIVVVIAEN